MLGAAISGERALTFQQVLAEAIADLTKHGYDSQARVDSWIDRLRRAAHASLIPEQQLQEELRRTLVNLYQRAIERGSIIARHPQLDRFTIERVKPKLRDELDRRILASANLIKLNREERINETLRRFSGWATSIPVGGTRAVKKGQTKDEVRKSLASLSFAERRVLIDQGAKLNASLSDILARDGNAIAARWNSHWRQIGYNYRPEHKARDGRIYLIRGNWAQEAGLVRAGFAGYTDEITQPATEISCRCYYTYIYNIGSLPADMLTAKGGRALAEVHKAMAV